MSIESSNISRNNSEERISPELLNTAGHELNHALVAMAMGAKVVGVSVKPDGNVLGVTTYAGSLSVDQIKMVAVAGSLVTHDGHASGYGSDMGKAKTLENVFGGISISDAKKLSQQVINGYSQDVRQRAAQLIAFRGNVTGSQLKQILIQARIDVDAQKHEKSEVPEFENNIVNNEHEISSVTKVAHTKENTYMFNYINDRNKKEIFSRLLGRNSFSNN